MRWWQFVPPGGQGFGWAGVVFLCDAAATADNSGRHAYGSMYAPYNVAQQSICQPRTWVALGQLKKCRHHKGIVARNRPVTKHASAHTQ